MAKNPRDEIETTPLYYAARHGNLNIIKYLLPLLDDKEPKDCIVQTPLHFAAKYGHTEVVIFMIMCSKLSKIQGILLEEHLASSKNSPYFISLPYLDLVFWNFRDFLIIFP